ncbi:MAG: hypothetical protein M0C28_24355 [Candidatus Moduliflexus flocculans]|nr:hypothetical protein [Candidatus Moduliflexus flocculans]
MRLSASFVATTTAGAAACRATPDPPTIPDWQTIGSSDLRPAARWGSTIPNWTGLRQPGLHHRQQPPGLGSASASTCQNTTNQHGSCPRTALPITSPTRTPAAPADLC